MSRRWDEGRPGHVGRLTDPGQVFTAVPPGLRAYRRTAAEVAAGADDPDRRARWEAAVHAWREASGLGYVHSLRVTTWRGMRPGQPYPVGDLPTVRDAGRGPWDEFCDDVEDT